MTCQLCITVLQTWTHLLITIINVLNWVENSANVTNQQTSKKYDKFLCEHSRKPRRLSSRSAVCIQTNKKKKHLTYKKYINDNPNSHLESCCLILNFWIHGVFSRITVVWRVILASISVGCVVVVSLLYDWDFFSLERFVFFRNWDISCRRTSFFSCADASKISESIYKSQISL